MSKFIKMSIFIKYMHAFVYELYLSKAKKKKVIRQTRGKRSRRNQEGEGSRVQEEKFVLKRGKLFLNKDPLGEDRDILRQRGEKVRTSLSDEISINYEAHSSGSGGGCVGLERGERLGTAAGGTCWRPARDGKLGYAAASRVQGRFARTGLLRS